uniref:Uncharacterized protein n=1 Tax=Timema shepardi TaxID=629360 RepID=A0A7R9B7V2_TIMSH|nr:unnamed protein product [Timema shepardi]
MRRSLDLSCTREEMEPRTSGRETVVLTALPTLLVLLSSCADSSSTPPPGIQTSGVSSQHFCWRRPIFFFARDDDRGGMTSRRQLSDKAKELGPDPVSLVLLSKSYGLVRRVVAVITDGDRTSRDEDFSADSNRDPGHSRTCLLSIRGTELTRRYLRIESVSDREKLGSDPCWSNIMRGGVVPGADSPLCGCLKMQQGPTVAEYGHEDPGSNLGGSLTAVSVLSSSYTDITSLAVDCHCQWGCPRSLAGVKPGPLTTVTFQRFLIAQLSHRSCVPVTSAPGSGCAPPPGLPQHSTETSRGVKQGLAHQLVLKHFPSKVSDDDYVGRLSLHDLSADVSKYQSRTSNDS